MKTGSEGNKNEAHLGGCCNLAEDGDDVGRSMGCGVGNGEEIQINRDSVGDE